MGGLALLLLPKCSTDLNYGSCPPARDWGSCVSGLVLFHQLFLVACYTTLHPALSVRWSVGLLVHQSRATIEVNFNIWYASSRLNDDFSVWTDWIKLKKCILSNFQRARPCFCQGLHAKNVLKIVYYKHRAFSTNVQKGVKKSCKKSKINKTLLLE